MSKQAAVGLGVAVLACACSAPTTSSESPADEFPSKTVKIIVPFAPGGSLDANSRILADCLNANGGEWVVENQEGGGGTIGVNNLVNANPDGYTLAYISSSGAALTPLQSEGARYGTEDLLPVTIVTNAPAALLVRAESPFQTAEDFFKAEGERSIATTGALGLYQLVVTELAKTAPVKPVPFDGTAPAVTAALGGNTDAVLAEVSGSTLEQIKSGQLRALATGAEEPVRFLPDVPTMASLGFALPPSDNYGLMAVAKGVPEEISDVIGERVSECASSEEVVTTIGEDFVLDPPLMGDEANAVIADAADQYKTALGKQ